MPKTDIAVRELIDKVSHGELLLPEMQRRYVWPATRVRDLLDSLYRGYPSGTILVWETDQEIETKSLAVKATKAPTSSNRLLLLDGQQRITSLAAILEGQPVHVRGRKRPIEILFNLEHPEGPPVEVLEVDENNTLTEFDDDDDEDDEYDIQEELRSRTFVVASRALEANPVWVCEQFAHDFEDDETFLLESGLLVRLLVVFATQQSRFKTVGRIGRAKLEGAWADAKEGLEFAINFVKSNAHIESLTLLSSPFLLVPIAVYGHLKKLKIKAAEDKALLRWFYLAHMHGHYSRGSSETILDGDLSVLFRTESLENLLKQLQQHVKQFEVTYADVERRGIRNPLFSMLYFVLKHSGAKDWLSGLKLSSKHVGKAHKLQFHHIFPKSLLKAKGYGRNEINEIANMAFIGGKANRHILNNPPSKYFPEDIIKTRGKDALTSQLVPLEPTLWRIENYQAFLDYRRKEIVSAINKFISALE